MRDTFIFNIKNTIRSIEYLQDKVDAYNISTIKFKSYSQIIEELEMCSKEDDFFNYCDYLINLFQESIFKFENDGALINKNYVCKKELETFKIINLFLNKLDLSYNFYEESFLNNNVFDNKFIFAQDNEDILYLIKNIIFQLRNLLTKIRKYRLTNNLFNDDYRVLVEEEDIIEFDDCDINQLSFILNTLLEENQINYEYDFFTDIDEPSVNMMTCFFKCFFFLIENTTKKIISNNFFNFYIVIKENAYKDFEEFLNKIDFDIYSDEELKMISDSMIKLRNRCDSLYLEHELILSYLMLDEITGLDTVKEKIEQFRNLSLDNLSLNICFYGNDGVGKSLFAKNIGCILLEKNILNTGHVIEITPQDLLTYNRIDYLIQSAIGGVLYIKDTSVFTNPNLTEIYKNIWLIITHAMTKYKGKICFIFSVKPTEIDNIIIFDNKFLNRMNFEVHFPNLNRNELFEVTDQFITKRNYYCNYSLVEKIVEVIDYKRKDPEFKNAFEVIQVLDNVITNQKIRVKNVNNRWIEEEDVLKYINKISNDEILDLNLNTPIMSINDFVGLENIKSVINKIKFLAKRKSNDFDMKLNMCFYGNPGTCKKTIGKMMPRILYDLNLIQHNRIKMVFIDELLVLNNEKINSFFSTIANEAKGGVLFIDSIHLLVDSLSRDLIFLNLNRIINQYKSQLVVILSGLPQITEKLFNSYPELKSKIEFHVHFNDYQADEYSLLVNTLLKNKFIISNEALKRLSDVFNYYKEHDIFDNAKTIIKVLNQIILNYNIRTDNLGINKNIIVEDVEEYIKDNKLNL